MFPHLVHLTCAHGYVFFCQPVIYRLYEQALSSWHSSRPTSGWQCAATSDDFHGRRETCIELRFSILLFVTRKGTWRCQATLCPSAHPLPRWYEWRKREKKTHFERFFHEETVPWVENFFEQAEQNSNWRTLWCHRWVTNVVRRHLWKAFCCD